MRASTIPLLFTVLLVGACGGGGGGGDTDLNGWWELSVPPASGGDYEVAWLGPASHSGSRVTYMALDLTYDGTELTGADPDFSTARRIEYHLTRRSPDLLEGQLHHIVPGDPTVYRDVRMRRRAAPDGRFTAEGNAGGSPVDVDSRTAYAIVESSPAGGGETHYIVTIADVLPAAADGIRLTLTLTQYVIYPIVRTIPAGCALDFSRTDISYPATNGSVQFTDFSATDRIRGSYEAVLGLDGAVSGTFDVPVRITR